MKQDYDRSRGGDPCSEILPGGVDLCVDRNVCKVRADVTVDRVRTVTVWGCVTDRSGAPVNGALVELLKYMDCGLYEVARTYTDCTGRYQFALNDGGEGRYRVEVRQGACPDACPDGCEPPCPPRCPEPPGSNGCLCQGSSSGGCRSVSRSNVQYY